MHDRRTILASGIASVAAIGSAGRAAAQNRHEPHPTGAAMSTACIDSCLASHRICLETSRYCIETGGALASPALLPLLQDCAELCQATANSLMRGSPLHTLLCEACWQACDRCARTCAAFADDRTLQRCVAACRECAASCREMAA